MPQFQWRLAALVQTLADETMLAEALLFPDVSCLHADAARLRKLLARRVRKLIKDLPPGNAYRHRIGELPQVASLEVEVQPLRGDELRQTPVNLRLHYVHWRHADAAMAYFPALQIEVLAENSRQLGEQLLPQVRSALARLKTAAKLRDLVLLENHRRLEVRPLALRVNLPTLKQSATRAEEVQGREKSVLRQVASDLRKQVLEPAFERSAEVSRLSELLSGPQPRSVLLVGRSGVGKTAVVRELARRRKELVFPRETPLWSTSGSRLVAGMSGFGMWQDRCQKLVRETAKTACILHLDHLVELIEVGKGGGSSQGIATVLRPAIARGEMLAIAECTPEQIAVIEREDPQLLEAFAQLEIPEATPEQTRRILREVAGSGKQNDDQQKVAAIKPAALELLDRLHRRYATYSASPGRPLRFLRNLLEDRNLDHTITSSNVTAAFSHETGLPLFMLDDAVTLDLATTRRWFTDRVIGQPEPVELVVDLIAAVKAGLTRGGKPIASLLFIGPTGVGKTEMSKALAEFLYQDPSRMIRFDMSEYAHPEAVERLIGGTGCSQGLLTQKVRDQPFMVVLLDEFEKAHPLFFDVLLQVLGEGRLTDGSGRVADFTSSVVIMTSNLGAESFRHSAVGFAGEDALGRVAERHFEKEVKSFLRPEMFNRLDRIVPFAPLGPEIIAGIAQREIELASRRDGLRLRGVNLTLEAGVTEHLAAKGFDSRYGARPLKRAIERELIAPLAERLTRYSSDVAIDCRVSAHDSRLAVETDVRPLPGKGQLSAPADSQGIRSLQGLVDLRRQVQALQQSGAVLRIRNEILRVKQAERQRKKRAKKRGEKEKFVFSPAEALAEKQAEFLQQIDKLYEEVCTLEEISLNDLYTGKNVDGQFLAASRDEQFRQLQAFLFELYQKEGGRSPMLTVVLYGPSMRHACQLAKGYQRLCSSQQAYVQYSWLKMYDEDLENRLAKEPAAEGERQPSLRLLSRKQSETDTSHKVVDVYQVKPEEFPSPPRDCIALALQIAGPQAIALLETESGKHEFFRNGNREATTNVEAVPGPLLKYDPPKDAGRAGSLQDQRQRRIYDFTAELCRDPLAEEEFRIAAGSIDQAIGEAAAAYLAKRAWALIDTWN